MGRPRSRVQRAADSLHPAPIDPELSGDLAPHPDGHSDLDRSVVLIWVCQLLASILLMDGWAASVENRTCPARLSRCVLSKRKRGPG
jgi:hypothetical protein